MSQPKGNAVLRWCYARWVQILAMFGLLGHDGRPSATKLWCAFGMICACMSGQSVVFIMSLAGMFGRPTLVAAIGSWRGQSVDVTTRTTIRHERDIALGIDPA